MSKTEPSTLTLLLAVTRRLYVRCHIKTMPLSGLIYAPWLITRQGKLKHPQIIAFGLMLFLGVFTPFVLATTLPLGELFILGALCILVAYAWFAYRAHLWWQVLQVAQHRKTKQDKQQ
ncbi:hypothetical protein [uncultured Umboniibacter sp.]|uniref:hypothetical protein n=1 Tax=uncultured Umboniibacter sp. TaxID=1798917 RepID=UPI0026142673|nr:hypothetical protein [uncultured Umboniibacter sp.]